MAIKIRKAKITKTGAVEAVYVDTDGNDVTHKGVNACHPDLKASFIGLVPFLADLTEQKEADSIDWDSTDCNANAELLARLDVTGFSIADDDLNPRVTIIGRRLLRSSKELVLNAPAVSLSYDTSSYPRFGALDIAMQRALYEVECYISERKWMAEQREIDFDNTDDPFAATPTKDVGLTSGA